jgi:hypothetical protein
VVIRDKIPLHKKKTGQDGKSKSSLSEGKSKSDESKSDRSSLSKKRVRSEKSSGSERLRKQKSEGSGRVRPKKKTVKPENSSKEGKKRKSLSKETKTTEAIVSGSGEGPMNEKVRVSFLDLLTRTKKTKKRKLEEGEEQAKPKKPKLDHQRLANKNQKRPTAKEKGHTVVLHCQAEIGPEWNIVGDRKL